MFINKLDNLPCADVTAVCDRFAQIWLYVTVCMVARTSLNLANHVIEIAMEVCLQTEQGNLMCTRGLV